MNGVTNDAFSASFILMSLLFGSYPELRHTNSELPQPNFEYENRVMCVYRLMCRYVCVYMCVSSYVCVCTYPMTFNLIRTYMTHDSPTFIKYIQLSRLGCVSHLLRMGEDKIQRKALRVQFVEKRNRKKPKLR